MSIDAIYIYIDSYIIYIGLGIVYIEILVFPDVCIYSLSLIADNINFFLNSIALD